MVIKPLKLQVKAHEAGSFEILFELYQSFGSQVSHFLTGDLITSALNLKDLMFLGGTGLYWLIKKLKGGKSNKIIDLKNGFVRLEFDKETFEVPINLMRIYQDLAVRKAAENVLSPLNKEGIDTFKVKQKNQVIETAIKDEMQYFSVPILEEEELNSSELVILINLMFFFIDEAF